LSAHIAVFVCMNRGSRNEEDVVHVYGWRDGQERVSLGRLGRTGWMRSVR